MLFNVFSNNKCEFCNAHVSEGDKYCKNCGKLCTVNGWRECSRQQCGNCHAGLKPEDKYCRICGTKAGEGSFEPYQNIMQCIYGPMPVKREHTCKKCGYKWSNIVMIDYDKFCPECGNEDISVVVTDGD